jgi:hypothetical protein
MDIDDDIDTLWPDVKILETGSSNEGRKGRSKRSNPDCTLLIKNLKVDDNNDNGNDDDNDNDEYYDAIEQKLASMFQPFAVQTNTNFVRTNLSRGDRTLAYVDYDSVDPVLAVLKYHAKTPLVWNGNRLEIIQKSNQNKQKFTTGGRKKNKKGRKQSNNDNNNAAANASTTSVKNNNDGGKKKTLPTKGSQQRKVLSSSMGVDGSASPRENPSKTTAIHKEEEDKTLGMKDQLQNFLSSSVDEEASTLYPRIRPAKKTPPDKNKKPTRYVNGDSTGSQLLGKNEKRNSKDNDIYDDVGKEIERSSNSKDDLVAAVRKASRAFKKKKNEKKANSANGKNEDRNESKEEIDESGNRKDDISARESRASKKNKKANNRQSDTVEKNSGDTNNNSRSKVKGKCHSCGKSGHYVRDCPDRKSNDDEKATATTIADAQDGSGSGSTKNKARGDSGDAVVNEKDRNGNGRGRRGGRGGRGRGRGHGRVGIITKASK